MTRPAHAGLRHLALNVRNLDAMKHFYVDLLGFAVEWQPDAVNIERSSGLDNLALHRSTAVTASVSSSASEQKRVDALDQLGLIVRKPEDVDAWAALLEGHGVAIDAKPRTHRDGARSCYLE